MQQHGLGRWLLGAMLLLAGAGRAGADMSFKQDGIADAVMSADNKTLIVSVPEKAELVYYDTLTEKEVKRVEVEFQPSALARQGDLLFAARKGAATIFV